MNIKQDLINNPKTNKMLNRAFATSNKQTVFLFELINKYIKFLIIQDLRENNACS